MTDEGEYHGTCINTCEIARILQMKQCQPSNSLRRKHRPGHMFPVTLPTNPALVTCFPSLVNDNQRRIKLFSHTFCEILLHHTSTAKPVHKPLAGILCYTAFSHVENQDGSNYFPTPFAKSYFTILAQQNRCTNHWPKSSAILHFRM